MRLHFDATVFESLLLLLSAIWDKKKASTLLPGSHNARIIVLLCHLGTLMVMHNAVCKRIMQT